MIATALLAAVATLAVTLLLGFLLSRLFHSRRGGKHLHMGVPVGVLQPWLIGLYVLMVLVIWKLIGREG